MSAGETRAGRAGAARVSRAEGFTLFEIMVALAILGGSMFILLDAHYRAMRLHNSTLEEVVAADLMLTALGQAELETLSGMKGDEGDFGKRFPGYSYVYDAQMDTENDPGFWTVTVTLKAPDGERQMTMAFYDVLRGQTPGAGGLQGQFGQQGLGSTARQGRQNRSNTQ
jgi:prepilin-type N-terminal cleavage/methylation domain-containing protein